MTGVQTLAVGTATNALSAATYSSGSAGLQFNNEAFNAGFRQTGVSVLSGMTSTLTSGALGNINTGADGSKLFGFSDLNKENVGKLNGLAGGLAGQAVEYGFTGDYKLNLANLSMLGIKGEGGTASMGLLELTVGKNGTSMKIGSGGANVSIDNVIGAIQGAMVWNVNNRIEKNDFDGKITLRAQYGYGDTVQKDQLWDILNGKAEIRTGANGDHTAETVMEDGKRVINLTGYNSNMSGADEMRLAVVLGHEAYRDGVVTADNNLETRTATLAHTEMLVRMLGDRQQVSLDDGLIGDLIAYSQYKDNGDISSFNAYVDNYYDSSADYWKLVQRDDGKFAIEYDGNHSLLDADGNILVKSSLDILGEEYNIFSMEGKIIGHREQDKESYVRSLGMLMGMYPDFNKSGTEAEYNEYKSFVASPESNDASIRAGIEKMMISAGFSTEGEKGKERWVNPTGDNYLAPNPYLMTYKDVSQGIGVTNKALPVPGFSVVAIDIKDANGNYVDSMEIPFHPWTNDDVNFAIVENMIPEGRRLNAGTFKVTSDGTVEMYGMGSTLPDPNKMGFEIPSEPGVIAAAIADGVYPYAWLAHNPDKENGYAAFRLFTEKPNDWSQVIGPLAQKNGEPIIPNFPSNTTNNWGNLQTSFPALYYSDDGTVINTTATYLNGHNSIKNPYVKSESGYIGGSLGCLIWIPQTFTQLTSGLVTTAIPYHVASGTMTINRTIFPTNNNTNNWWQP